MVLTSTKPFFRVPKTRILIMPLFFVGIFYFLLETQSKVDAQQQQSMFPNQTIPAGAQMPPPIMGNSTNMVMQPNGGPIGPNNVGYPPMQPNYNNAPPPMMGGNNNGMMPMVNNNNINNPPEDSGPFSHFLGNMKSFFNGVANATRSMFHSEPSAGFGDMGPEMMMQLNRIFDQRNLTKAQIKAQLTAFFNGTRFMNIYTDLMNMQLAQRQQYLNFLTTQLNGAAADYSQQIWNVCSNDNQTPAQECAGLKSARDATVELTTRLVSVDRLCGLMLCPDIVYDLPFAKNVSMDVFRSYIALDENRTMIRSNLSNALIQWSANYSIQAAYQAWVANQSQQWQQNYALISSDLKADALQAFQCMWSFAQNMSASKQQVCVGIQTTCFPSNTNTSGAIMDMLDTPGIFEKIGISFCHMPFMWDSSLNGMMMSNNWPMMMGNQRSMQMGPMGNNNMMMMGQGGYQGQQPPMMGQMPIGQQMGQSIVGGGQTAGVFPQQQGQMMNPNQGQMGQQGNLQMGMQQPYNTGGVMNNQQGLPSPTPCIQVPGSQGMNGGVACVQPGPGMGMLSASQGQQGMMQGGPAGVSAGAQASSSGAMGNTQSIQCAAPTPCNCPVMPSGSSLMMGQPPGNQQPAVPQGAGNVLALQQSALNNPEEVKNLTIAVKKLMIALQPMITPQKGGATLM